MSELTERQLKDWPDAVAEAQRYVWSSTIPTDPHHWEWDITYDPESRPGRGRAISALWLDGEYIVQIRMDVYGYPSVAVAETRWLHNSDDEQCECLPCRKERSEYEDD